MKPNLKILRNVLLGTAGGSATGYGLSQLENKHLYDDPKIQSISTIVGTGTGGLSGALMGTKHKGLGLALLGSFLGLKQMGLLATDSAKGYFDAVKEREKNETKIRNLILDTQKSTERTAKNLEGTTKYLADTIRKAFPYASVLGAGALGLYAYNSLKNKDKTPQPINLKVDNKLPERSSKSMYLEIPSNKISDKFYNQFGREILFKGDEEQLNEALKKQIDGTNLTKKEKNLLKENNLLKSASVLDIQKNLPSSISLDKLYYKKGPGEVLKRLKLRNPNMGEEQQLEILKNIESRNTSSLNKIINFATPILKQTGILK